VPQASAIAVRAEPPAASRRGACPTLREPMPTGDGLLARFRPIDGTLSLPALAAVARAAEAHGNGLFEITQRGSLQVRGLSSETSAALARDIIAAVDVETGVPVETPPLAGLDDHTDPRPFAAALRRAIFEAGLPMRQVPTELAAPSPPSPLRGGTEGGGGSAVHRWTPTPDPSPQGGGEPNAPRSSTTKPGRLSPKVTVIVESGASLAGLAADIRVEATGGGWRIDGGDPLGETAAIAAVLGKLEAIAARGPLPRGRVAAPTGRVPTPAGPLRLADGAYALGLALPFGSIDASALAALAEAAGETDVREVRLAPRRGLYLVGLAVEAIAPLRQRAETLGFVADPADPRLAIAACAGRDGCASGRIATRTLAGELAHVAPDLLDGSVTLHVSGCGKGCAHPRAAELTLVGLPNGACGVVLAGPAAAGPAVILPPDAVPAGFAALARLYRAREHAQESAAEWLARLGPEGIAAVLRE
jgi:precorrin-3B synthase